MIESSSGDWLYSARLDALREKKLNLELKKAEVELEKERRDLEKLQNEIEIERLGGRNLHLPDNTREVLSKLPPKDATEVAHYLAFVLLYGDKSGNDILQAAISFNSTFPPLARHTEGEGANLLLKGFSRGLDVIEKMLPQPQRRS